MDQGAVGRVRAFNRLVAERIGALTDEFLERRRPMGQSRILWEIGAHGAEVRELRGRLGLDSGYLSRVLQSLARQGLVTVSVSKADCRVHRAQLTKAGRAELAELDQRSDAVAWSILEPLSVAQRARLVASMNDVQGLLRASMVRVAVEDPATPAAQWCIAQYFSELNERFDAGFDPSRSLRADVADLVPPHGVFLLARERDQPVGCGALKFHGGEPAELKRMWVSPDARGLGLGRRLLEELERHARAGGARTVHLETNRALKEAIDLYRTSGYREVCAFNTEPYAHHWFEKHL